MSLNPLLSLPLKSLADSFTFSSPQNHGYPLCSLFSFTTSQLHHFKFFSFQPPNPLARYICYIFLFCFLTNEIFHSCRSFLFCQSLSCWLFSANSRLVCFFVDLKIIGSCSIIFFKFLCIYHKRIVNLFLYFVNHYHVDYFFFFLIKDKNFITLSIIINT